MYSTMRTSQDDCLLCEEVEAEVEGKEAAVCCKYACSVGDCADIWVSREIVYRFRSRFISSQLCGVPKSKNCAIHLT